MKDLTLADLEAWSPTIEAVELPEMGGRMYVRQITADAYFEMTQTIAAGRQQNGEDSLAEVPWAYTLLAYAICDAKGQRLFGSVEQVMALSMPASVGQRLFAAASRLNRMTEDDALAEQSAEGNGASASSATPTGGSPTA